MFNFGKSFFANFYTWWFPHLTLITQHTPPTPQKREEVEDKCKKKIERNKYKFEAETKWKKPWRSVFADESQNFYFSMIFAFILWGKTTFKVWVFLKYLIFGEPFVDALASLRSTWSTCMPVNFFEIYKEGVLLFRIVSTRWCCDMPSSLSTLYQHYVIIVSSLCQVVPKLCQSCQCCLKVWGVWR